MSNAASLPDRPAVLADLVQYQPAAIVSRTLLKQGSGSVTLFAFDQGQELSEHATPFDALLYVFDGEADITITGIGHRVRQGETILLPAREPHAVRAPVRFKMMLTMIRG